MADEDTKTCGFAAEVSAIVAEEAIYYLKGPIIRNTSPDTPVPFSPLLEKAYLFGKDEIVESIRQLMVYS